MKFTLKPVDKPVEFKYPVSASLKERLDTVISQCKERGLDHQQHFESGLKQIAGALERALGIAAKKDKEKTKTGPNPAPGGHSNGTLQSESGRVG